MKIVFNNTGTRLSLWGALTLLLAGVAYYTPALLFHSNDSTLWHAYTDSADSYRIELPCTPIERTNNDVLMRTIEIGGSVHPTHLTGCFYGSGSTKASFAVYDAPYSYPHDKGQQIQVLHQLTDQGGPDNDAIPHASSMVDIEVHGTTAIKWIQPTTTGRVQTAYYILANDHLYLVQADTPDSVTALATHFMGSFDPTSRP